MRENRTSKPGAEMEQEHQWEVEQEDVGRRVYGCQSDGCGEVAIVPVAGSAAWYDDPKQRYLNRILGDMRLRRLQETPTCPGAAYTTDELRRLKRERRRSRLYKVAGTGRKRRLKTLGGTYR